MLYEAIRLGCEQYHENTTFNFDYDNYLRNKRQCKWDDPTFLDLQEVNNVIDFVNKWQTQMPTEPVELLPSTASNIAALEFAATVQHQRVGL